MKRILLLGCLLNSLSAQAEMFFGPSSSTNRLLIATNEAIIIQTAFGGDSVRASMMISNVPFQVSWNTVAPDAEVAHIFPGPGEFVISNRVVIQFERIQNASIGMMLAVSAPGTNIVQVPAGQKIQFFSTVGTVYNNTRRALGIQLLDTNGAFMFGGRVMEGQPLDGPLTILVAPLIFFDPVGTYIGTYWITDDVFSMPDVVTPGATAPLLLVQKSRDLTNWSTVATINETLGSNSFYRIRVGRNTPPTTK